MLPGAGLCPASLCLAPPSSGWSPSVITLQPVGQGCLPSPVCAPDPPSGYFVLNRSGRCCPAPPREGTEAARGHAEGWGLSRPLLCSGPQFLLLKPCLWGAAEAGHQAGRRDLRGHRLRRGTRRGRWPDPAISSRAPPTRPASCGTRRTRKCLSHATSWAGSAARREGPGLQVQGCLLTIPCPPLSGTVSPCLVQH